MRKNENEEEKMREVDRMIRKKEAEKAEKEKIIGTQ